MTAEHPKEAERLLGALDDVEQGSRIAGWARSPGGGGAVEVEIIVDGRMVGRAVADRYRDDLAANGWGDCAFWFDLPHDLLDGAEHLVGVRFAATAAPLGNAPRPFRLSPRPASERRVRGALDGVEEGGWAAGWARDPDSADKLTMAIWIDGAFAGDVVADRFRDDLERDGSGDCAFWFGIPEAFHDGAEHAIDARDPATGRSLPGAPQTFRLHAADAALTDGVNLIPSARFDVWPNGLRIRPRERFAEIVSGWFYDFRRDRPPITTIAAESVPNGYALRVTIEEGGSDARIRLIVPIAVDPVDLSHHRFSIDVQRPVAAEDEMLHLSSIFVGVLRGMTIDRLIDVHGVFAPRGAGTLTAIPAKITTPDLDAGDADQTLALVLELCGDGELAISAPELAPAS